MPRKKSASQRKYSQAAGQEVKKEMHKFKQGTAQSGKGHTPVKNRAQAIAIGLSEARKKGEKAPAAPSKKGASSRSQSTSSSRRSPAKKKSASRKSTVTQRSSSRNSHVRRARYSGY
jgi:hypothetical protein